MYLLCKFSQWQSQAQVQWHRFGENAVLPTSASKTTQMRYVQGEKRQKAKQKTREPIFY